MAKGKRQSGRKGRGDDSEDEEETEEKSKPSIDDRKKKTTAAAAGSASNAADQTSKPSRKEKRQQKQKQQAKHRGKGESSDDDGESGIAELLRGKRNDYAGSDDEDLPAPSSTTVKRPVNTNIQKKGTHTAMMALMQDSDDDDDGSESEQEEDIGSQQLSRKGKKKGAAFPPAKMANSKTDSDEEMDKPSLKGKKKKSPSAAKMVTFDSSDDEENAVVPQPSQGGNKKNAPPASGMAALKIESDTEDEDIDVNDDSEEVEQVAMVLADDDWAAVKKKSKKDRKEKKEKKEKKDKKEKKEKKEKKMQPKNIEETKEGKDADTAPTTAVVTQKKSKFELQMEAAMSKQKEAKVDEPEKDEGVKPPTKLLKELEPEPDWVDTVSHKTNDHSNDEVMYGAPDDKAWTDKSAAQIEQEETVDQGGDSTMYGPDGKKLSNKERKRLIKAKEAAEREAAFEKSAAAASRQGAQFACSQTAVNENDPQWENSLDINIPSFSISAAGKILFKDASLTVGHGRRYGLVAPNGRGKSTLLKMIASRDLKLPPRIDFLYVEQEVVADDTPAVEAVLRADTVRWDLMKEEASLMKAIDDGDEDLEKLDRLQAVIDELRAMGADAAEAKARRILYGLGFSMEMQTKPTRMFSGGWRMRISLARALFVEPTLLMLDEPTNHLDLNAVIWLDEYLQKWKKTLLVVSHDQDFLNSITQEILHIEDLKLCSYKGNYDSFKKAEHTKFLQQVKAWEKQEKRLKELKRSGQSRSKAEETLLKSTAKRESGGRNQKKKDQAVAAGTEAAENTELVKRPKEYQVKLEFVEVAELSRPVMEVSNVHFRYSPKHPIIFDKIDFGIDMDSRVCIVGPNGAGKSTLLKLLTGELNPTTGEVKRNARLRMGIYNQHFVERLPMNKTAVEYLRDRFPEEDYQSIRNRLGKYGLEGHAHEVTMRDLSGGQKARVVFVDLSLSAPHILLLDEPTNNLDIETIDALCDAINQFNGGIVVVTHDQRLIEECEMTLWVVEKRGVTRWEAGFEDYKATILRELEEAIERENAARQEKLDAAAQAKAAKLANLSKKVKKK